MTAFELQLQILEALRRSPAPCHAWKLIPCLPHTSFNYLRLLTTRNEENRGWKNFFQRCHKYRISPAIWQRQKFFLISQNFSAPAFAWRRLIFMARCWHKREIYWGGRRSEADETRAHKSRPMSIDTLIPSLPCQSHRTTVYCHRKCFSCVS